MGDRLLKTDGINLGKKYDVEKWPQAEVEKSKH